MTFFDASTAADLAAAGRILGEMDRRAADCGAQITVIGAAARDILIRHVVGSDPERATADVDIAIAVPSWKAVEQITAGLVRARRSHHTFVVHGVELDIVPFGGIETQDRTITWPNDHLMNVLGFKEALATAVHVRLPGGATVAVASLPAQSLLKLLAWKDRRFQSRRDAIDLRTIVQSYHQGPYLDELYARCGPLLEKHGFDPAFAGAERLGGEAKLIIGSSDHQAVTDLLSAEEHMDALAADMGWHVAENLALIAAYRAGFIETGPAS
jgi:predicted nucleotidyltransferase